MKFSRLRLWHLQTIFVIFLITASPISIMLYNMFFISTNDWTEGIESIREYGVGFYIHNNSIVTSYSLVSSCSAIKIRGKSDLLNARVLAMDSKNNIAVLQTNKTIASKLILGKAEDIKVGNEMLYPVYTNDVGKFRIEDDEIRLYQNNKIYSPLDSTLKASEGAPILNENGYVIGVSLGKQASGVLSLVKMTGYSVVTDVLTLKHFLYSNTLYYQEKYVDTSAPLDDDEYEDNLAVMVICIGEIKRPRL